jgi:hypothetical protein
MSTEINTKGAGGVYVEIWLGCKFMGHGDSGTMIWWGRETDVEG